MSDQRDGGISWTDETWNPIRGCSRVSEGCRNCYAEKVAGRFSGPGLPYEGLVTIGEKGPRWNGTVRLVPEHLGDPLRWKRPRRVFVNSMSDLFHESLPFETIAAVWGVMAAAPQHTFQVLTKRPKRALEFFEWLSPGARFLAFPPPPIDKLACLADDALTPHMSHADLSRAFAPGRGAKTWPLPNVWLGVSVEDQATADERIPLLLECPAAVRWVSYEPALGPVLFQGRWLGQGSECPECGVGVLVDEDGCCACGADAMYYGLDWIVVGGESGPGARPYDLAWARNVITQCREAGVPVFHKQLGADPRSRLGSDHALTRSGHGWDDGTQSLGFDTKLRLRDRKGGDMAEWPEDLRVRQWPKTEAS